MHTLTRCLRLRRFYLQTALAVGLLGGQLTELQPVLAAVPELGPLGWAKEVDDSDLADMRGRYATNGQVINFGIEMVTTWRTAEGTVLGAGVTFQVDSELRPTLTITEQKASSGSLASLSPGQSAATPSPGGLANVSGVVQSIQIGGDGNDVKNGIQMDLYSSGKASAGGSGVIINGSGTYESNLGGGRSTVILEKNSLALVVDLPGRGSTVQRLSAQGLHQNAMVGSDFNQVRNNVNLVANTRLSNAINTAVGISHLQGLAVPGRM